MPGTFVIVVRETESESPETLSDWWEDFCYGENPHPSLGGEVVFIAGAIVIATAEATVSAMKTVLGSETK